MSTNRATFGGGIDCFSFIGASSYNLSNDAVYARSSYDAKIKSDSGGMYLEMGDIGNADYFKCGVYSGVTFFQSESNRPFYFRQHTSFIGSSSFNWDFSVGGSYNSDNSTTW